MLDNAKTPVTWEDTKAWIGRALSVSEGGGCDAVEAGTIRRRLEVLEFGCPLHYDEKAAKEAGYEGVFAPYTMLQTYSGSAIWRPGQPTLWRSSHPNFTVRTQMERAEVPQPGTHSFVTDIEIEYFQPVYLGDRVSVPERRLLNVNPKRTSVGEGAFVTWESRFCNQRGDLVGVARTTWYVYVPHPRREGETAGEERGGAREASVAGARKSVPERGTDPRSDWSTQLFFEDAKEGDDVPQVAFPITIQRLVMEAGANRDFNAIHHNREIAHFHGAPDMFCNNFFLQGMWERTVREYIGLRGTIRKIGPFRMRIFNPVGDTVVVKGNVLRKFQKDGQNWVELKVWSENSRGVSVGPGPVLVTLPSR
ncbi:MAG: MaoC family dehydratase N-terminal domain-containing protein [Deltaproteobacteria bacterium]|nr:MaoC family dehydratase N-terminal domain-containing protein [Deltaproteobacteria bacterium]